jgi:hypothetical protein
MKHGVSKWLILCSNCTKTHLRASVDQKKFFRLAIARHEGRGKKEGGGVKGRGEGKGEGIMGGEWEGREGEGREGRGRGRGRE